jgi:hypothetical protein
MESQVSERARRRGINTHGTPQIESYKLPTRALVVTRSEGRNRAEKGSGAVTSATEKSWVVNVWKRGKERGAGRRGR